MMMMSGRNNNSSNFSRYPFTPTQWQELEQQALIYKYMASGIPIPSDLLLPIKRSFLLNSTPTAFTQPAMGWSCFQMGYGRKAEDPEPGRCRRTDGKKWRCSKEAYPDSKYCERHMHRGKNRSRKPVEISLSANNINTTNTNTNSSPSSTASDPRYPYPLLYPHPYSSSADRDHSVDEYSSWELRPLGLGEPKLREEGEKDKHCFVLGADFKQDIRPVKERDFFDGWPRKSKGGSWMGLEGDQSTSQGSSSSCSKTQLSISIPMGLHDFPQ